MKNVNRRGSALLIVLGMLSFMLFSGLAFSLYMRQARLPSSFLRRSSVTRQIAKAALAEAMEEVDWAINNNPHPGVGDLVASRTYRGSQPAPRNYWYHRVYTGTNRVCNASETVPTLTLEGLAYLPPAFINEVRYFSRRTPTARWHRLRFDAGRYAYTAVDVSDCFDVNKLFADYPRSSAACRRVTFAHAFEQGYHDGPPNGAGSWDDWLENEVRARVDVDGAASFKNVMPFVSLADFNVAIRDRTFGNIKSPFVEYIKNNGNGGQGFYQGVSDSATDAKSAAYGAMTFVTDSWNPIGRIGNEEDDDQSLASDVWQPFETSLLTGQSGSGNTLQKIVSSYESRRGASRYNHFLSALGLGALSDYLDEDSIPISLAIPTVERVPMISALKVQAASATLKITKQEGNLTGANGAALLKNGTDEQLERIDTYRINGGNLLGPGTIVRALALYPFRHQNERIASNGFKVDGRLSLFLTAAGGDVPLVTGSQSDALGFAGYAGNQAELVNGVINIPFGGTESFSFSTVNSIDDALQEQQMTVAKASQVSSLFTSAPTDNKYFVKVKRTWTAKYDTDSGVWSPASPPADGSDINVSGFDCRWPALTSTGNQMSNQQMFDLFKNGGELRLNAAVWVRVRNPAGKTVDLVPASISDDQAEGVGGGSSGPIAAVLQQSFGRGSRLLKLDMMPAGGGAGIPFSVAGLDDVNLALNTDPRTLMVPDPRYNHDPESWFTTNDGELKEVWKNNNCYDKRDGDPFMTTSDQGYLQSAYELAMIPRSTPSVITAGGNDRAGAHTLFGALAQSSGRINLFGSGEKEQINNYNLMWKTYNPYPVNGMAADDFESLALVSGEGGVKVNPFSDSSHVLMAAFANTPRDWAVASTNRTMNPHWEDDAATFNAKYAWNTYSLDAKGKLDWSDLENLCDKFRAAVGDVNKISEWPDAFAGMWGADNTSTKMLAGVTLQGQSSEIYSIDRKFLYGFWRECFEARQQLFLLFVRAEPMMMGGGVTGAAPPQLGTRAVALVWRDPREHNDASSPHRMRVLFYHPLD